MKKNVPTEEQEQIALAQYLDLVVGNPGWFHVPNGGDRHAAVAGKLKAQGVKPGVSDVFITRTTKEVRGLGKVGVVIELKRQNMRPSDVKDSQWTWMEHLASEGWITYVAKGWEDARQFLDSLGYRLGVKYGQD